MPLSYDQTESLPSAIANYRFPPEYFDFVQGSPRRLASMKEVEVRIEADLRHGECERVKNGLSNVLYWGYAQQKGTSTHARRPHSPGCDRFAAWGSARTFCRCASPSVLEVRKLGLPEFSGLSFAGKVRMFLDPTNSATLDRQLMKIREYSRETMLRRFRLDAKGEQIRITKQNAEAYEAWCQKMAEISAQYFGGQFRAVDIERSFFCFVQTGRVELAAQVLSDA